MRLKDDDSVASMGLVKAEPPEDEEEPATEAEK
jgi:hypothetical protein